MTIVSTISRLPSFVEYQGCTFILCTGREYKKYSELSAGILLCYKLDSVDKESIHYRIYSKCGSWEKPDYGTCNFLVLYEYIDNDDDLIKFMDETERYLLSLGIEL